MRFIWKILIINETKRALFVYPTIGLSCGRNFKYGYPYKVKVYSSISLKCFLFFFCLSLACSKFFCVFATLWTSQMKCWQVGVAELKGGIWKLEQADDLIVRTNECAGNLINVEPPLLLLLLLLLLRVVSLCTCCTCNVWNRKRILADKMHTKCAERGDGMASASNGWATGDDANLR